VVLVPAGAGLNAQGGTIWYIGVLALCSGVGRVLGALVLYWLSSHLGRYMFARRERWLGLNQAGIDRFRHRLGRGRAWWALFLMWAIPIFPGAPISLAGGFINLRLSTFISATFWGSIVNGCFYLYLGYAGLHVASGSSGLTSIVNLLVFCLLGGGFIWLLRRASRK
jgi:uncharacterized membrane protein YdjX (TVP38/TMEM64 family)